MSPRSPATLRPRYMEKNSLSLNGHSSIGREYIPQPIREQHSAHVVQMDQSESRKILAPKNRRQGTTKDFLFFYFFHFLPPKPLGTPSGPFSEGPRQIWRRKRKCRLEGSNPVPLACQPHAITTGLPRLTHNKTGKIDLLILQPERQSTGSLL